MAAPKNGRGVADRRHASRPPASLLWSCRGTALTPRTASEARPRRTRLAAIASGVAVLTAVPGAGLGLGLVRRRLRRGIGRTSVVVAHTVVAARPAAKPVERVTSSTGGAAGWAVRELGTATRLPGVRGCEHHSATSLGWLFFVAADVGVSAPSHTLRGAGTPTQWVGSICTSEGGLRGTSAVPLTLTGGRTSESSA